jgi:hypothetical protein
LVERRGVKRKEKEGAGKRARRTEGIRAMVTPELLEKLRARAALERRTLSTLVEMLLEQGVEKK